METKYLNLWAMEIIFIQTTAKYMKLESLKKDWCKNILKLFFKVCIKENTIRIHLDNNKSLLFVLSTPLRLPPSRL